MSISENGKVVLYKVWRSELTRMSVFCVLCIASVILSAYFPGSIITGELIRVGDTVIYLSLPLFALMPFVALGDLIARVYDVRYILSGQGIEARSGIVSFSQHITKVRYEDIRLVEIDQSLCERFLDVGTLLVGTAATGEVEVRMQGIEAPAEVQRMIQLERDRRQQLDEIAHNDRGAAAAV